MKIRSRHYWERPYSKLHIFDCYIHLDTSRPGQYKYGGLIFNFEPFYVGKGCNGRATSHLKAKSSSDMSKRIRKIKCTGNKIRIMRIRNLTEKQAFDFEINLIALIGRKDKGLGPLLNRTDGGQGFYGFIHKKRSVEWCNKISKAKIGHYVSAETIAKGLETKRKNGTLKKTRKQCKALSKRMIKQWKENPRSAESTIRGVKTRAKNGTLKRSIETRIKISKAQKGKKKAPRSSEHCANLSRALKGLKHYKRYISPKIVNGNFSQR
jgi:hypothetical protein